MRLLPLSLCLMLAVAGCARIAESRLNPLNWFGRSEAVAVADTGAVAERRPLVPENRRVREVEGRPLVAEITALSIDRTPGGALVRATGRTTTQGYYNAQLVLASVDGGLMTFAFRAEAPAGFAGTGTPASRTITAATALSDQDLAGIRTIRVEAASGARVARR